MGIFLIEGRGLRLFLVEIESLSLCNKSYKYNFITSESSGIDIRNVTEKKNQKKIKNSKNLEKGKQGKMGYIFK